MQLKGKIAIVTGATRGAGRGIACMLGELGATVYCTGRSALTPGFLRSEAMLDHFGVTEENWQDAAKQDPHFIASETPFYIGRAVAALASDPNVFKKSGCVLSTWNLAPEYGFTDIDGRQPNWGKYFAENVAHQE